MKLWAIFTKTEFVGRVGFLYAMISLESELNPKMFEIVRKLTGAGIIPLPATQKCSPSALTGQFEVLQSKAG